MRLAPVALGPFVWPRDVQAGFRLALLRGLARVAARHPELLDALEIAATILPTLAGPVEPRDADPTKNLLGKVPVEAMLARIGYAAGPQASDTADLVLSAAALLLFQWAVPEARQKRDIKSAVNQGCAAVRQWWEPTGEKDAFPDSLATLLRQYSQITDDVVPELVEALKLLSTMGTSRLDCFERAVAFLQVESGRHPRGRKERTAQATPAAPSVAAGAAPAYGTSPTAPTAPPAPVHQGLQAMDQGGPTESATPSAPEATRTTRYRRDLPDRATREADAKRCIQGGPHGRVRRARQSHDQILPLARTDQLHAPDWDFLRGWMRTAAPLDQAITLALLYSGQSPDGMLQCRVAANVSALNGEPDVFWLVLAPFGLVIPNLVNPELPPGPGSDPAAQRLFLPLPESIEGGGPHPLQRLQDECAHRVGGPLCGSNEMEALAARFDADAKVADSAMRLSRLGRPLERALYNGTGSGLVWQYVRNRAPDTAYFPALHYERFELVEIIEHHRRACDVIDRHLCEPTSARSQVDLPWDASVGSRFCPSDDQVRALVRRLRAVIERRPRGAPTAAKLAEFHNALTHYTLLLLMAASALRPSIPGLDCMHPMPFEAGETPVWLINDKPQLGSGGRVVPIAPIAQTQWLAYERHCQWIEEHPLMKSAISRFKREVKQSLQRFFLFGPDLQVESITPRTCASLLAPLKENSLRHWMLDALRRRGWKHDRIALFAGHAGVAHSPTAPWSTAARWSRAELRDIEDILAAAGWNRHEGMGRG